MRTLKKLVALFLSVVLLLSSSELPASALEKDEDVICHIIPHSHCDPGWLDTFEVYYDRQVVRVLDNVMQELGKDSKRRFVWSETSFLKRWYEDQTDTVRAKVRAMVKSGQLEFVNGGWSQNDEANPDYVAIINQMTEGHEYLQRHFGVYPEIGWQIDPFGHSNVQPFLSSLFGFKALFINRIHTALKAEFKRKQHMEFMWNVEDTDFHTSTFTHVLHTHYSAPKGYDWEENAQTVSSTNIEIMSRRLCDTLRARAQHYRSGHVFVPFGDDFKFQAAGRQFHNMDQIIAYVNKEASIPCQMRYSTPSEYLQAVKDKDITVPEFSGDFYPYADNEDSYWTGYFTTRPVLKQSSRRVEHFKRSAEILAVLAHESPSVEFTPNRKKEWTKAMADLGYTREQTALFLHHDAITGTAKPNVVEDYIVRMTESSKYCERLTGWFLTLLLEKQWRTGYEELILKPSQLALGSSAGNGQEEKVHPVVVFNNLAWPRKEIVSVRVSSADVALLDSNMNEVECQLDRVFPDSYSSVPKNNEFLLHFVAEIPALGISTYFVQVGGGASALVHRATTRIMSRATSAYRGGYAGHANVETAKPDEKAELQNSFMKVSLDKISGLITSLTTDPDGKATQIDMKQVFTQYTSSRSGAYLMRCDGASSKIDPMASKVKDWVPFIRVTTGPVLHSASAPFGDFDVSVTLAACDDPDLGNHVVLETSVVASSGFETVLEMNTNARGMEAFHTHNGRQFMKRGVVAVDDKKAGSSFFPAVTGVAMLDDKRTADDDRSFLVVTDHTMGAASRVEGRLEFVLHRWLRNDDGRGLGEGVHDATRVNLPFWFLPSSDVDSSCFRRHSLRMNFPVQVFGTNGRSFGVSEWQERFQASYSGMTAPLDDEVHLLSLYARDTASDDVILRLEQLTQTDKNRGLSRDLFRGLRLKGIRPVKLSLMSGQQSKATMKFKSSADAANGIDVSVGKGDGENQNTEEEGVFVSQAAVDKRKEEEERRRNGNGRRLLADDVVKKVSEPITTFLVVLDPVDSPKMPITQDSRTEPDTNTIAGRDGSVVQPDPDVPVFTPQTPPVTDEDVDKVSRQPQEPRIDPGTPLQGEPHGPVDELPSKMTHVSHTEVPDGMPGEKPPIIDVVKPPPEMPVLTRIVEPQFRGQQDTPIFNDHHNGGKSDFDHLRADVSPAHGEYFFVMGATFTALLFMLFRGVGCRFRSSMTTNDTEEMNQLLKMN